MNSAEIREALASNRSKSAERGNARITIVKAALAYADLLEAQERGEAVVVRQEDDGEDAVEWPHWAVTAVAIAVRCVRADASKALDALAEASRRRALAASQGSG